MIQVLDMIILIRMLFTLIKIGMQTPGVDPESKAWKAPIMSIRPRMLIEF